MKHFILLSACAATLLTACDRPAPTTGQEDRHAEEARALAEREARLREGEQALAQQKLDDAQAALERDRQKLEAERATLRDDQADRRAELIAQERVLAQRREALAADAARQAEADRRAREQREARATQNAAEQKLDLFYTALDPMGDWLQVEPYGYVWQPREAGDRDWRPYTDGNWAYTDYGWTWKSNESFGWATYHYGRWAKVRRVGWVWVPGSEWAPAWVSWRRGGEYVGWAPLPPEAHSGHGFNGAVDGDYDIGPASYNFIPVQRVGEPTYRGVVVEAERNVTIVNNTVNVTKINYTQVQNKTVVFNGGPDLGQINAVSAQPIQRLTLQRTAAGAGDNRAVVAGNVLRMAAPQIASAPRAASAPAKVKQNVKQAEVEHGWGTSDPAAIQTMRNQARQNVERPQPAAPRGPNAEPVPTRPQPSRERREPVPAEAGAPHPATPREMAPADAPRREATPAEAPRREATPAEAPRREATPRDATPAEAPRREATPREATPAEAPRREAAPAPRPAEVSPIKATPVASTPRPAVAPASTPRPAMGQGEVATPAPRVGRPPGGPKPGTPVRPEVENPLPTHAEPAAPGAPATPAATPKRRPEVPTEPGMPGNRPAGVKREANEGVPAASMAATPSPRMPGSAGAEATPAPIPFNGDGPKPGRPSPAKGAKPTPDAGTPKPKPGARP